MKRLLPVFFILIFFSRCGKDSVPSGIIPADKMVHVLTDVHLTDGYIATLTADSGGLVSPALYQSVFKKYATDSTGFVRSLQYYSKRPAELEEMYKQVKLELGKLQETEDKRLKRILIEEEKRKLKEKRLIESRKKKMKLDSIKAKQDTSKSASKKK